MLLGAGFGLYFLTQERPAERKRRGDVDLTAPPGDGVECQSLNGLAFRAFSTEAEWFPDETPSVRLQLKNVSAGDIVIRPFRDKGLWGKVNAALDVRLASDTRASTSSVQAPRGAEPTSQPFPKPIPLGPGEITQTFVMHELPRAGSPRDVPLPVTALDESPSQSVGGAQEVWQGNPGATASIEFIDPPQTPPDQLIKYLDPSWGSNATVCRELVRRWTDLGPLKGQHWQAMRSSNGEFVLFDLSQTLMHAPLRPGVKGSSLMLFTADGKRLWSRNIPFVELPAEPTTDSAKSKPADSPCHGKSPLATSHQSLATDNWQRATDN